MLIVKSISFGFNCSIELNLMLDKYSLCYRHATCSSCAHHNLILSNWCKRTRDIISSYNTTMQQQQNSSSCFTITTCAIQKGGSPSFQQTTHSNLKVLRLPEGLKSVIAVTVMILSNAKEPQLRDGTVFISIL